MEIQLPLGSVRRLLWVAASVLAACGLAVEIAYNAGWRESNGVVDFFSLSYEANLPTWYSVALLLSSALVLGLVAAAKRGERAPYVWRWWLLAATFLYVSVDELAELHEPMSTWFDYGGVLLFSWVLPAAALLVLWAAVFIPFLRHLPPRTRRRFVAAGAIYVLGGLIMELPLGWWTDQHGNDNLGYALIDWVEETLEIGGVSLFLYSLIEYAAAPDDRLRIVLGEGSPPSSRAS